MKDDKHQQLVARYKEGKTSLEEEKTLFRAFKNTDAPFEPWSSFVTGVKKDVPADFNNMQWKLFNDKTEQKPRFLFKIMSTAAAIGVFITLYFFYSEEKKLDYAQKEALLEEAINMIPKPDLTLTPQTVIYENEMVIIYTTKQ